MIQSRRIFIAAAAAAPVAALFTARAGAAGAPAPVCYDPATLPLSQKNRRRSLGYVEVSADTAKRCSGCAFFKAATPATCGSCQLLGGATVKAEAVCNSYAAKPKA